MSLNTSADPGWEFRKSLWKSTHHNRLKAEKEFGPSKFNHFLW